MKHLAAGDLDGRGSDDLVIDFGPPYGLWILYNDATWAPLHPFSVDGIVTADLDGLGRDEIVVNFGPPYGLWAYSTLTGWRQLHDSLIDDLLTGTFH